MTRRAVLFIVVAAFGLPLVSRGGPDAGSGVRIDLPQARFALGDDPARADPQFDDHDWPVLATNLNYEKQGFAGYDGWSWYRIHVTIPSSLKKSVFWKKRLRIYLSSIDDVDETFLNGIRIGQTGRLPGDPAGYDTKWQALREYFVDLDGARVRWDADNVIAIRVFDGSGGGGFHRENDHPYLSMAEIVDGVGIESASITDQFTANQVTSHVTFANRFPVSMSGRLSYDVVDAAVGRVLSRKESALALPANGSGAVVITAPQRAGIQVHFRYTEKASGKSMTATRIVPYVLTPAESPRPQINGAKIFGARPGAPFLFRIAASGRPPLTFTASGLPAGLSIGPRSGLVTGKIDAAGDYPVDVTVRNALGSTSARVILRAGATLAPTPPMGWNSWNVYGLGVNDARIRETAAALVNSGLAAHGWSYVNIDDGWESAERLPSGSISSNQKFPHMEALGTHLHSMGLKFGIYSSPGPLTCGRFLGSLGHERQDADTYASWGVDFLKYDLCSYEDRMSPAKTLEEHQLPYRIMGEALRAQPRDIVFSLCQYGNREVWKWGADVGGSMWRLGGDIEDTWQSVLEIIARQDEPAAFAGSGRWNDPDMLVVGRVGWGGALHPSRLTPDEQYSHISLWALLAAPLLLGNDLTALDTFTRNLLVNDEVIAIDQDPRGSAARRVLDRDGWQVWKRELSDGSHALGVFNFGEAFRELPLDPQSLNIPAGTTLRDVWRQRTLGAFSPGFTARVPAHGVLLLLARPAH